MKTVKEYSAQEAQEYTNNKGKNTRFYKNIYGWNLYYTLEPTFATPTGLENYKRSVIFHAK